MLPAGQRSEIGALGGGRPSEGNFRSAIPSSYYTDDGGAFGWGSKALQNATPLGLGDYSWNPSSGGIFSPETFQPSDTGSKILDFLGAARKMQNRNSELVGGSDIKAGTPGAGFGKLGDDIMVMMPGQTQQQQPSRFAGALGGATAGAQLGSMFGPVGTGVGAIAGGLLGLFG